MHYKKGHVRSYQFIRTLQSKCTPAAAAAPPAPLEFSQQLISWELYVQSDFARCQKKDLDKPDSTMPKLLGLLAPLVVKIGINKLFDCFFRFLYLNPNISITICMI